LKKITIKEIEWHDAQINDIRIESNKDAYDSIRITISSENFVDEYNTNTLIIILQEVFKAKFKMNMWITGNDVINTVSVKNDSEWIRQIRKGKKENFGPKNITHFSIKTNTNSCLEFLITKDLILDF